MTIFCTYCSADKNQVGELLPAIERYQSQRIQAVYSASLCVGVGFLILSGKFGLLKPCQPIPYYDHLLQPGEVSSHSAKVAAQIHESGIQNIIYFTRPVASSKALQPYLHCIQAACDQATILLTVVKLK
jgi:hypothetical protein